MKISRQKGFKLYLVYFFDAKNPFLKFNKLFPTDWNFDAKRCRKLLNWLCTFIRLVPFCKDHQDAKVIFTLDSSHNSLLSFYSCVNNQKLLPPDLVLHYAHTKCNGTCCIQQQRVFVIPFHEFLWSLYTVKYEFISIWPAGSPCKFWIALNVTQTCSATL